MNIEDGIVIDGPNGKYPPEKELVLVQFDDGGFGLRELVGFDVDGPQWYTEENDFDDFNRPEKWWSLPK